jgi:hypothetical protein
LSLAIKPSSTPSASPSRPSAGPPRGPATPPRPTAGPGWCWPPTPSCAWPAPSPATSGCRGSGPDPSRGCHRCECGAGFRGCCALWARQRVRRNPSGAPQADPGAAARDPRRATRRSRSQPPSPGRSRARPPKPPERLTIDTKRRDLGRRPTRHAHRVKSQAKPVCTWRPACRTRLAWPIRTRLGSRTGPLVAQLAASAFV